MPGGCTARICRCRSDRATSRPTRRADSSLLQRQQTWWRRIVSRAAIYANLGTRLSKILHPDSAGGADGAPRRSARTMPPTSSVAAARASSARLLIEMISLSDSLRAMTLVLFVLQHRERRHARGSDFPACRSESGLSCQLRRRPGSDRPGRHGAASPSRARGCPCCWPRRRHVAIPARPRGRSPSTAAAPARARPLSCWRSCRPSAERSRPLTVLRSRSTRRAMAAIDRRSTRASRKMSLRSSGVISLPRPGRRLTPVSPIPRFPRTTRQLSPAIPACGRSARGCCGLRPGSTLHPQVLSMQQIVRTLTMAEVGGVSYRRSDLRSGSEVEPDVRRRLRDAGIRVVLIPSARRSERLRRAIRQVDQGRMSRPPHSNR